MFPQKLLKRLSEIFSRDSIEFLVTNHFTEIVITIVSLGAFVILIIITLFALSPHHSIPQKENISKESAVIKENTEENAVIRELLLSPDDMIIPSIRAFEVNPEFVDFLPRKKFELPDIKIVVNNFNVILNNSIDETLKFNFEKRKKGH